MKESERLTKSGEDWFWKDEEAWVIAEEVSAEQIDEVYYKLAAYEDTGLSPEEVEKLKDNVYPADKVEHLISEMETLIRALKVKTSGLLMKIKVLEAEGKNGIQER